MDNKELRTLQIFEQIENDESISQRAMAGNLNVSLGLVNSFIKRLVKKGYVKATTIPKNRISYLLTSKGAVEKAELTYKYIRYSFSFYKNTREKLFQLFDDLHKEGVRKVAFFGVSELAEIAYITIQQTPMQLVGIYDDQVNKFLGNEISVLRKDSKILFDKIIITKIELSMENKDFLESMIEKTKIVSLG